MIKKNILFITLVGINDIEDRNIYADLMRYFVNKGHHVTIVSPIERRQKKNTFVIEKEGFKIIRPKTLNNQKVNKVEKLAGILSIDFLIKKVIKKHVNGNIDLIIYSTPPITLTKSIAWAKTRFNCRTYLLLKDIFPQNAVDLGFMGKGSFFHKHFLKIEKELYKLSDSIGCMSQANVDYVLKHNPEVDSVKVEICPNSVELIQSTIKEETNNIRTELGIPDEAKVLIYGGNLGKPQGIDFLIKILDNFINIDNVFFVIIGSGTEYHKLKSWYDITVPKNMIVKSFLPKEQYDQFVHLADIGLIFLDAKFTIPNYPSRVLSYMEYSKPILAFTDKSSDIGSNAASRGYGDWAFSDDINASCDLINVYLSKNMGELQSIGKKGHDFLETNYQPFNSYKMIVQNGNGV